MFLQNSEKKIEEEFLKLTEKLGADKTGSDKYKNL